MLGRKLSVSEGAKSNEGKRYYGVYRAKCLDNNDPDGLNRILVHIFGLDGEFSYDEAGHTWVPVLSPYGGVPQMGFFMIPPIHANGFVIFERGVGSKPIWIGSFPFADKQTIDEEASNDAGYTIMRTEPTVPPEMGSDPSRIILKTQYPSLDNPDQTDSENKVENLLIMDESKLQLLHVNQARYQYSSGGVAANQPSSSINLSDSGIRLGVTKSDGTENFIEINNSGVQLSSATGEIVSVGENTITLRGNKASSIEITAPNGGTVFINGQRVILDGEKIIAGPPGSTGGGGAVTNDTICPLTGMPTHIGSAKTIIGG